MCEPETAVYSAPRVPPELSDRIIDFLHNDYVTLSAVSLVCRSFLPATRFHRFAHLALVGSRIEGFNKLLDISPALGSFVSELVLEGFFEGQRHLGAADGARDRGGVGVWIGQVESGDFFDVRAIGRVA